MALLATTTAGGVDSGGSGRYRQPKRKTPPPPPSPLRPMQPPQPPSYSTCASVWTETGFDPNTPRETLVGFTAQLLSRLLRQCVGDDKILPSSSSRPVIAEGGGGGGDGGGQTSAATTTTSSSSSPSSSWGKMSMPSMTPFESCHQPVVSKFVPKTFVEEEMLRYVTQISNLYRDDTEGCAFHNWRHACHVLLSTHVLTERWKARECDRIRRRGRRGGSGSGSSSNKVPRLSMPGGGDNRDDGAKCMDWLHLAAVFAALIHDVQHLGVTNKQLEKERHDLVIRDEKERSGSSGSITGGGGGSVGGGGATNPPNMDGWATTTPFTPTAAAAVDLPPMGSASSLPMGLSSSLPMGLSSSLPMGMSSTVMPPNMGMSTTPFGMPPPMDMMSTPFGGSSSSAADSLFDTPPGKKGGSSYLERQSIRVATDLLREQYQELYVIIVGNCPSFLEWVDRLVLITDIGTKELQEHCKCQFERAMDMEKAQDEADAIAEKEALEEEEEGEDKTSTTSKKQPMMIMRTPPSLQRRMIQFRWESQLEQVLQMGDVGHCSQAYDTFLHWNENLYRENLNAYRNGRGDDPRPNWYKGQIGFFEGYILPLAKRCERLLGAEFGLVAGVERNLRLWKRKEAQIWTNDLIARHEEEENEDCDDDDCHNDYGLKKKDHQEQQTSGGGCGTSSKKVVRWGKNEEFGRKDNDTNRICRSPPVA